MKVLKFIAPYHPKTGKPNFPERGKTGVYLIKEGKDLVYIGYSGKDLYKTMYRHFQTWNHTGQEVVSYADRLKKDDYTVRVVYCNPRQAEALEKALIKKHKPRDNGAKYESLKLMAYDRNTLDIYQATPAESVHFTAAQLKHMQKVDEEDRLEREAVEEGPEASELFGPKKNKPEMFILEIRKRFLPDYQDKKQLYYIIDIIGKNGNSFCFINEVDANALNKQLGIYITDETKP